MKAVFLFPGQGSQESGMCRELYRSYDFVRQTFTRAADLTDINFKTLLFDESNAALQLTVNTQLAVILANQVHFQVLQHQGLKPILAMGHSLGEYSALIAAEVISFDQALTVVSRRAAAMHQCARSFGSRNQPIFMTAVISRHPLDVGYLETLCSQASRRGREVRIANDNSPFQLVLSGSHDALEQVCRRLKAEKIARTVPLRVEGPFHSSLMTFAEDELATVLKTTPLQNAQIPIIANLTADFVVDKNEIRRLIPKQVTGMVRWRESIEQALKHGYSTFVECGHGSILTNMLKKCREMGEIYDTVKIINL